MVQLLAARGHLAVGQVEGEIISELVFTLLPYPCIVPNSARYRTKYQG